MNAFESDKEMRCSLCGTIFEIDENTCKGCGMSKNCTIVCCPNCGFGAPRESKLASWLNRRSKKGRSGKRGTEQ